MEKCLTMIRMYAETTITKSVQNTQKTGIIHNHPPVRFLVKTCPHCIKYGNIFVETQ